MAETAAEAAASCRKLRRANWLMVPLAAIDRHLPAGTREVYAAMARMVSAMPRQMTAAVRHDQFLPVSPRLPGETCCPTRSVCQNILLFAMPNRTIYRNVFHIAGFRLRSFQSLPCT